MLRLIGALCAALVVLTSCTQVVTGAAAPASSPPAGADLERFYAQDLAWGPCREFATNDRDRIVFDDPAFDCARLEVPLDYARPTGDVARIAVLRRKATGPDRIGSLLVNPGGPGASGASTAASLAGRVATSPLGQRFDLVGFDPRGVGASTPALDCLDDAEWEAERADLDVDPSPQGVEQTEAENRAYAERCAQRSGGAEVLANVGTRDVVRDLDVLRAALGDEDLTYLGYSYGTRIGSEYAEAFPGNVRALVLDGALDPSQSTVDRTVAQNAGFQKAFDAFAADCASRPGCPLGDDPARATAAFQELTRPLIDSPLRVGRRTLSYSDALTGTVQALYSSQLWSALSRGLTGLADGDGRVLLTLADLYYGREATGTYDDEIEAFIAISCVDEERITDRAVQADLVRRATEASPFRDDGRGVVAALDPCAFWPAPTTGRPHVPQVQGLPPVLVVSTTGDPATPYQAGVDLATALGGALITNEGDQHTVVLQGKSCVDDAVVAYLVDLQVPQGEVRCGV